MDFVKKFATEQLEKQRESAPAYWPPSNLRAGPFLACTASPFSKANPLTAVGGQNNNNGQQQHQQQQNQGYGNQQESNYGGFNDQQQGSGFGGGQQQQYGGQQESYGGQQEQYGGRQEQQYGGQQEQGSQFGVTGGPQYNAPHGQGGASSFGGNSGPQSECAVIHGSCCGLITCPHLV